jgi:TM2 domain-containing membrane protein YozV
MKSKVIAYILWFVSGFGAAGFHRFYLGKYFTGFLWLFTGGLSMVGSIYDGFTLGKQIDEINTKKAYLADQREGARYTINVNMGPGYDVPNPSPESLESKALRFAKRGAGYLSIAELAEGAPCTVAEAEKMLDGLVSKGVAEFAVRPSGLMLYRFPAFLVDAGEADYTV